MANITLEMTQKAYELAKNVYQGEIEKQKALDILEKQLGMNRGSAHDYINGFRLMMEGATYKRTFNNEATDYLLTNILKDFGSHAFQKALLSVGNHLNYYESLGRGSLKGIRSIYDRHSKITLGNYIISYPDEIERDSTLTEGATKTVTVNSYERNPEAREKCLKIFGYKCSVCSMSFEEKYGELGKSYIHVHHIKQLIEIGQEYTVNPETDLRPVCPNCHAMLHRRTPALQIQELKDIINNT